MGHTQCISKSADCQAFVAQSGSCRLDELCAEPPGTPAITSDLIPEKPYTVTRVKERRLEPNRADSSEEVQRLQNAMTHLHKSDLEKAYDRVPREELWYCMRKSGVAEKYVRVVQDMYERSRTVVRCAVGQTEEFKVKVGLHQGSALSPFLFAIVMDQLSEEVRQESPWTMMFADDIVICSESREQVEENLERWRFALERRGMKVSRSKTEYMCVNEREGSGTVRLQGEEVKKVQEFKYLGSTVQSNGECGKEVKKRVQAGWYWGSITAAEAKQLLNEALDGSFLVRDSSNPGYLLTLSVKTELGPTHLRIEYTNGHFGFDSVGMARPHLRQFKGAVDLVQYYTLAYRRQLTHRELGTDPDTLPENTLQLRLTKPRHKAAPSLQHLCRVLINQYSHNHRDLPLPEMLKDFLREYPFVL
ncbi:hypothetical protein QTP86_021041 [Hemibagrus guttatus]|nr:hypothetical protein QTP86_021041 [Hemibagrus guttatus]